MDTGASGKHTLARRARPLGEFSWAGVAIAVVVLAVPVAAYFQIHRTRRADELERMYAGRVAHLADRARLVLQSHETKLQHIHAQLTAPSLSEPAADEDVDGALADGELLADLRSRTSERWRKMPRLDGVLPSYAVECGREARRDCIASFIERAHQGWARTCSYEVGYDPGDPRAREAGDRVLSTADWMGCGWVWASTVLSDAPSGLPADGGEAIGDFDQLVLALENGEVLYQGAHAGPELTFSRLPRFDDEQAYVSTIRRDVVIGAQKYRIFSSPVGKTSFAPDGRGLLVAGLVSEDRLSKESDRFSPLVFVSLLLILVIGVLAWPVAKVWLAAPGTPIRRFDVLALATSGILTAFFATTVFWVLLAHNRLVRRTDDRLQLVAAEVKRRVEQDVAEANEALDGIEESTKSLRSFSGPGASSGHTPDEKWFVHCANLWSAFGQGDAHFDAGRFEFPGTEEPRTVCEGTSSPWKLGSGARTTAPWALDPRRWTMILWADKAGDTRLKIVQNEHATQLVNLGIRKYFVDAIHERGERRAHVEVVRSITRAAIELVVAKATGNGDDHDGVALIVLEPRELHQPVLPLDMRVAMVDQEGRVALHSHVDSYQGQPVFDQLTRPDPLRAIARSPDTASVLSPFVSDLDGIPSRVYVAPSAELGLLVVATSSALRLEQLSTNIGLIATLMYLLTVLAVGAIVAGRWLFHAIWRALVPANSAAETPRTTSVLRPTARLTRSYRQHGRLLLLAAATVSALAFWLPLTIAALLAGLAMSAGILASLRALRRELQERHQHRAERIGLSGAYATYVAGLVAMTAVAPACVFFAGAFDESMDRYAATEQAAYRTSDGRERCDPTDASEAENCVAVYRPGDELSTSWRAFSSPRWPLPWVMNSIGKRVGRHPYLPAGAAHRAAWPRVGLAGSYAWRSATLITIGYLFLMGLGFVVTHRTTARLFFLRQYAAAESRPTPGSRGWTEGSWRARPAEERRVLLQLAVYGYVSPHPSNVRVVERLLRYGMLGSDRLELASAALERHIRSQAAEHEMRDLQKQAGTGGAWATLRLPLGVAVATLVVILGYGEPDLLATGVAAPSIAALIPAVLRAAARLGGGEDELA